MKSILSVLFLTGILSCTDRPRAADTFPTLMAADETWHVYEGFLHTQEADTVTIELKLKPASPGLASFYEIWERIDAQDRSSSLHSRGEYIVLAGAHGSHVIQILNKRRLEALTRGKLADVLKSSENLFLKSSGDHQLVYVDEEFNEMAPRSVLNRRSELFTSEGYFTVYDDTTEFFEKNTGKAWAVAQFGAFDKAVSKYHALAKAKHEGIYLKALAYSIRHIDHQGNEINALVFKKVLEAGSAGGPFDGQ